MKPWLLRVGGLLVKCLTGLTMLVSGGWYVHLEMQRAVPSNLRLGGFGAVAIVGALILPSISDLIIGASKRAIDAAAYGRRAYDNSNAPKP